MAGRAKYRQKLAERAEPGVSHSRGHLLRLLLLPGLSEEHPSYSCCHLPAECHSLCPLILTSVTIGFRESFMCLNSSVIPISCPIEPPLLQTMSCGLSRHSWHTVSGNKGSQQRGILRICCQLAYVLYFFSVTLPYFPIILFFRFCKGSHLYSLHGWHE